MPIDSTFWIVWTLTCLIGGLRLYQQRRVGQRLRDALVTVQQERDLLRALVDASPVAQVVCSEGGRILVDNAAARRLFFEGAPAQGQNFLQLVANGPKAFQAALSGPHDAIVGLTVAGQHESYHFARRSFQHAGEQHHLLSVRPMTREIARHELEVLKRVLRLLSHEVNNSLAPMSSLVHSARAIVRSGERFERLSTVFDTLEERSRHLASFIAGYAGLARLPDPAPQSVAWRPLAARLAALYPSAAVAAADGGSGFFDPAQLEQVLINLLKNAHEAGGTAEDVRLEIDAAADLTSELRVLDRGRGFSDDALEHALLPFYTTKAGGSGVGLALVREVVHAHGGRLTFGNQPGGGAAIHIWLPGPGSQPDPSIHARLTLTHA